MSIAVISIAPGLVSIAVISIAAPSSSAMLVVRAVASVRFRVRI